MRVPFIRSRRRAGATAAAVLAVSMLTALAQPASAVGPVWKQVLPTNDTWQIGVARGSDGTLHVVWAQPSTAIYDTPITATGTIQPPLTVHTGSSISPSMPAATATPTGLVAMWGEFSKSDPHGGIYTAKHPLATGTWALGAKLTTTADGDMSATTGNDGVAWGVASPMMVVTKTGQSSHKIAFTHCCQAEPGLAADGVNGDVWVGFYSDATNQTGVYAQRFTQAGSPSGAAVLMPGSANADAIDPNQRVAVAGRGTGHGGVYVAYPTQTPGNSQHQLRLWNSTSKTSTTLGTFDRYHEVQHVALTPDGAGGLWLAYVVNGGTLYTRHSNATVTSWSAPKQVALPAGSIGVGQLNLDARAGKLDIVCIIVKNGDAYWHAQVS
jgi:hypothetical protein